MQHVELARSGREERRAVWFRRGVLAAFSIPGLILVSAFVGFAGLARDAGLTLAQAVFMTGVVWALPGKVVLVGAILSGNGLPAAALAVALSSVRLAPMVVALTPEMRTPRTPAWVLYALSHFVAVTSWVLAMQQFRHVPRSMRTTYYAGLGATLVLVNMGVVAVVFAIAGRLPPAVSAALFFLTPMYFLTSLWGSARERAGQVAMVLGLVLGPVFHLLLPEFDLLAAGLVAGLAAFAIHLSAARRGGV
ncbi:AzlC family ABC transporter permease [Chelativorans intermedius]|uniref:AzlC family ABC transporter permease n=1 Tax=Chelativorans intermedius TaxID=515947 RepID=A0ABV6D2V0_9HYPH|nr:AzlC family ABC transporter permease [Chelativorans intermedius]MCT8998536.1 AzlC family ABC transporter permease [Chelativorans intermedius]